MSEQDFLDSLATPFASNWIQDLRLIQLTAKQAKQVADKTKHKMTQEEQEELEMLQLGVVQQQHPVLSVELYLDIERRKDYVLLADSISEMNLSYNSSE